MFDFWLKRNTGKNNLRSYHLPSVLDSTPLSTVVLFLVVVVVVVGCIAAF